METEAVGPLSAMGIVGGSEAQDWNDGAGKDTGILFNLKHFSIWSKDASSRLTIAWRLTF